MNGTETVAWLKQNVTDNNSIDQAVSVLEENGFLCQNVTGSSSWDHPRITRTVICSKRIEATSVGFKTVSAVMGLDSANSLIEVGYNVNSVNL